MPLAPVLFEVTIRADPPARLDKALMRDLPEAARAAGLSRSRLARLIGAGAVARAGEAVADARARVAEGEVYTIALPQAEESHIAGEKIALDIAYEDSDLIVVNKPAGMVVHPAPGTPSGTLVNALIAHCGENLSGVGGEKRPGVVHRIDKDTSGLLVAAKSDAAHQGLAAQFAAHSVHRRYLAVTHGVPDPGDARLRGVRGVGFEPGGVIRITSGLARHRHERQRQAVTFTGGRHAITRLRVIEAFDGAALVECWLETGRTHQIRVHLAHVGHGLIGDPVYGGRRRLGKRAPGAQAAAAFARQALHAAELGFTHPVSGAPLDFSAPIPADMRALLACLRGDEAG